MSMRPNDAAANLPEHDAPLEAGAQVAAGVHAVDVAFLRGVGYGVTLGGCIWVLLAVLFTG